jgi:hypothetical protein
MTTIRKYLELLRPSVQRDLVALVHGCHAHPAYRAIRRSPVRHGTGYPYLDQPAPTVVLPLPPCHTCAGLYAAKRRVKALLS